MGVGDSFFCQGCNVFQNETVKDVQAYQACISVSEIGLVKHAYTDMDGFAGFAESLGALAQAWQSLSLDGYATLHMNSSC